MPDDLLTVFKSLPSESVNVTTKNVHSIVSKRQHETYFPSQSQRSMSDTRGNQCHYCLAGQLLGQVVVGKKKISHCWFHLQAMTSCFLPLPDVSTHNPTHNVMQLYPRYRKHYIYKICIFIYNNKMMQFKVAEVDRKTVSSEYDHQT